jgi:hypothetical protein
MEVTVSAQDKVTVWIHHMEGAKTAEVVDVTGKDSSIADRRLKIGNLEIVIFEE